MIPETEKQAAPGSVGVLGKPEETRLGKKLLLQTQAHQGLSGFHLLASGTDAFLARALMIDAAERTIDLQYYIVQDDTTTRLLFIRLLRAADRGVKVRMLIDDTNARAKGLAELTAHANIQVRTFNSMQTRYFGAVSRYVKFLANSDELNHRMHNKMLSVDGVAAIVGGRNLSDAYYEARPGLIFMDLDLWTVGPVLRDLEKEFEEYWQSPWSRPIGHFKLRRRGPADVEQLRERLKERTREAEKSEYAVALKNTDLMKRLESGELNLVWGRAELVFDTPEKVNGVMKPRRVGTSIRDLAEKSQDEVFLVSPYLIPQPDGMRLIAGLRRRGVAVRALTNSLRATDTISVYAAYRRYRPDLLKEGVDLFELKPTGAFKKSMGRRLFGSKSLSSLHAKAYIFDRNVVLLGSFNLDPRSKHLNTEMGLIVYSPELARQVLALVQETCKLKNSYHLVLEESPGSSGPRTVWVTEDENGNTARFNDDPGKGFSLFLTEWLLRVFPLEGLL